MRHFDCAVIGSGPGGQKAAIQAAKLGKRVAIIEKNSVIGGAGLNTGTIPSKALREAVLHLTGANRRGLFGESYRAKRTITINDLIYVSQQVIHHELHVLQHQLERNGVELIWGTARFESPNTLVVERVDESEEITADTFVIATGTRPARPGSVPFNETNVFDSDGLLKLNHLPRTMIVVGGGVIGTEYACMMATLGVKVILVEGRQEVLGFLDHEITEAFQYHMRRTGITLRLGEKVAKIEQVTAPPPAEVAVAGGRLGNGAIAAAAKVATAIHPDVETASGDPAAAGAGDGKGAASNGGATTTTTAATATATAPAAAAPAVAPVVAPAGDEWASARPYVQATLESGKTLRAQTLLYAVGRQGTTSALQLDKAGLKTDDRERLAVNENYQTAVPHIYAVGDVIGFPALASTAMEQGRLAVCHAYGVPTMSLPDLFPFGVYAVPEISMVGKTEKQLTDAGIPYEAGVAQYKELARGQLLGDETGMLKLLIHQQNQTILGVHAIGTGATELIHIGQAVMALGGTVDYFIHNVFNFPTLAEAYKVAALNGLNKLRQI